MCLTKKSYNFVWSNHFFKMIKLSDIATNRLVATTLASSTLGLVASAKPHTEAGEKTNIIFIMTDQQTASAISCAGNCDLQTPAMDALARDGVRLERAYCPFPLSGPSRASLLTGCTAFEVGATDNNIRPHDEDMAQGLGHRMSQAGYECLYAGKWHIPEVNLPKTGTGFKWVCDMNDPELVESCRKALAERDESKPLLLVASFLNPHEICEFARDQSLHYGELEPFLTEDCPNLPPNFMPSTYEAEALRLEERLAPRSHDVFNYTEDDWRRYRYAYYRLVERVDKEVGLLVQLLKEQGLYDDSLIIFTSDHGDGNGAHQWNQKWALFEEVINVPLIVKAPSKSAAAGSVNREALCNIGLDIYSTICDYAGIKLDRERYRGKSLRDVAEGREKELHPEVFVETLLSSVGTRGWAIVEGRYKYVLYQTYQNREMLYDLESDRGEMINLAVDKRYCGEVDRLRQKMYEWSLKVGDKRLERELKWYVKNPQTPTGHIRGNR